MNTFITAHTAMSVCPWCIGIMPGAGDSLSSQSKQIRLLCNNKFLIVVHLAMCIYHSQI